MAQPPPHQTGADTAYVVVTDATGHGIAYAMPTEAEAARYARLAIGLALTDEATDEDTYECVEHLEGHRVILRPGMLTGLELADQAALQRRLHAGLASRAATIPNPDPPREGPPREAPTCPGRYLGYGCRDAACSKCYCA